MRLWFILLMIAVLSSNGCTANRPGDTTVPKALLSLQNDIAQSGAMSMSGSTLWSEETGKAFASSVLSVQCKQKRADPIMALSVDGLTMVLTGSYTTSGQFTIGSITTAPTLGFQTSGGKTSGQTLTIPVKFSSLSSVPDVILTERLSRFQSKEDGKTSYSEDTRVVAVKAQYWDDYYDLMGRVTVLVKTYNIAQCAAQTPVIMYGDHKE